MSAPPREALAAQDRLRVNAIRCVAFGFCADFAPEFFGTDEWGYPVVHHQTVSPEHEALARQAAKLCPVRAILLEQARRLEFASASPRDRMAPAASGTAERG